METTAQELRQAEVRRVVELRAEVVRCMREGDDVEGLRALVARRGYALGALSTDGLLNWGLEGALRFGAFGCLREILYNVYGVRVSTVFQNLSTEVCAHSARRVPMSDEVLQRVERVVAMLVERLPADWDLARERRNSLQWLSWAVWVALAPYAPLGAAAEGGEGAAVAVFDGEGAAEGGDDEGGRWLLEYVRARPVIADPPDYRWFWTSYFVQCADTETLETVLAPGMNLMPDTRAAVAAEVGLREQRRRAHAFAMTTHPRLGAGQHPLLRDMPLEVVDMIGRQAFRSRTPPL